MLLDDPPFQNWRVLDKRVDHRPANRRVNNSSPSAAPSLKGQLDWKMRWRGRRLGGRWEEIRVASQVTKWRVDENDLPNHLKAASQIEAGGRKMQRHFPSLLVARGHFFVEWSDRRHATKMLPVDINIMTCRQETPTRVLRAVRSGADARGCRERRSRARRPFRTVARVFVNTGFRGC